MRTLNGKKLTEKILELVEENESITPAKIIENIYNDLETYEQAKDVLDVINVLVRQHKVWVRFGMGSDSQAPETFICWLAI